MIAILPEPPAIVYLENLVLISARLYDLYLDLITVAWWDRSTARTFN